jgi:hypothetical protein
MDGTAISSFMKEQYFGKGLYKRATPEETEVWREMRTEAGVQGVKYGSLAFGGNYILTYPMKASRLRLVRVPLHFFAFMTGFFYGTNRAAERGLVRFLSLQNSPNATVGREWIRKTEPTNPLLIKADLLLKNDQGVGAAKYGLGSAQSQTAGVLSKLPTKQTTDGTDVFATEPVDEGLDLVAPGMALSSTPQELAKTYLESIKPEKQPHDSNGLPSLGKSPSKEQKSKEKPKEATTGFKEEEDPFAVSWNGFADESSDKKGSANDKHKERTWDEVRVEWLKKQASQPQASSGLGKF